MRLLAALAALLVLAPAASASVVSATVQEPLPHTGDPRSQAVSILAGAGETNAIVVDRAADATIVYDLAGARPGAGCVARSPTEVRCRGPKLERVIADLGDGDDRLQLDA